MGDTSEDDDLDLDAELEGIQAEIAVMNEVIGIQTCPSPVASHGRLQAQTAGASVSSSQQQLHPAAPVAVPKQKKTVEPHVPQSHTASSRPSVPQQAGQPNVTGPAAVASAPSQPGVDRPGTSADMEEDRFVNSIVANGVQNSLMAQFLGGGKPPGGATAGSQASALAQLFSPMGDEGGAYMDDEMSSDLGDLQQDSGDGGAQDAEERSRGAVVDKRHAEGTARLLAPPSLYTGTAAELAVPECSWQREEAGANTAAFGSWDSAPLHGQGMVDEGLAVSGAETDAHISMLEAELAKELESDKLRHTALGSQRIPTGLRQRVLKVGGQPSLEEASLPPDSSATAAAAAAAAGGGSSMLPAASQNVALAGMELAMTPGSSSHVEALTAALGQNKRLQSILLSVLTDIEKAIARNDHIRASVRSATARGASQEAMQAANQRLALTFSAPGQVVDAGDVSGPAPPSSSNAQAQGCALATPFGLSRVWNVRGAVPDLADETKDMLEVRSLIASSRNLIVLCASCCRRKFEATMPRALKFSECYRRIATFSSNDSRKITRHMFGSLSSYVFRLQHHEALRVALFKPTVAWSNEDTDVLRELVLGEVKRILTERRLDDVLARAQQGEVGCRGQACNERGLPCLRCCFKLID